MGEAGLKITELWPIALMFILLYFLMIRPQQKRQKEQKLMLDAIGVGDEVITSSGIFGTVTGVSEGIFTVEIAPDVNIKVQKAAITTLLPKGTLENPESLPPPPPSCCA